MGGGPDSGGANAPAYKAAQGYIAGQRAAAGPASAAAAPLLARPIGDDVAAKPKQLTTLLGGGVGKTELGA